MKCTNSTFQVQNHLCERMILCNIWEEVVRCWSGNESEMKMNMSLLWTTERSGWDLWCDVTIHWSSAGLPMILLTEQLNLDIPWNRSSKWNAKITWSINKIEPHYFPHKNFRWWIFRDSEITLSEVWGWKFHLSSLVLIYIFFCFLRNKVVRSIALLELSFGIAFKEGGRARTN